ncbi:AAA family ATPase [Fibrobacter sp. UWB7]|uniref:AAA family ATPase n=1 Tax=Fibrobacter sp. UWB7 TaxID=1896206 RepID=UPI00091409CF|nr:AAA family ATPase [Fibrobacter sp. UWB7]SHM73341.1 AAA domain-containing protein [Fibrobacter sp. UWB7]
MKISIENCNNINKGEIEIIPNTLNIKYASNGTGKSTIAKAISTFTTQDEKKKKEWLDELIPYKYADLSKKEKEKNKPIVSGLEDIHHVEIFNDEYVNQFLFVKDKTSKKEVLINDSFSIFVKTPEYDENMKKISSQLQKITQNIQNNKKLESIINLFEKFRDKGGKGKEIGEKAKLYKAFNTGNMLANIAPQFKEYENFLQDRNDYKNVKWVKWASDGKSFFSDDHSCPLCRSKDKPQNLKIVEDISSNFPQDTLEELTEILNIFEEIKDYLDENSQIYLKRLATEANALSKEILTKLSSIRNDVIEGLESLTKVKSLTPSSIDDIDNLISDVKSKRINFAGTALNGNLMNELVEEINSQLDEVYNNAISIKENIDQQKQLIQNTVETNKNNINAFLRNAGYNYQVEIEQSNGNANIYLKSLSNTTVKTARDHLSYGERNAFAMVLFMYSAIRNNPDLIILDDPISSFDGNKKFALLNMMFLSSQKNDPGAGLQLQHAPLENKTVLLLTHDFTTVLDIIHTLHRPFSKAKAHFLANRKGILEEKRITKEDFTSGLTIIDNRIEDSKDSSIIQAIYLRRRFDFIGDKSEAYNMLSSLLHKREKPTIRLKDKEKIGNRAPIQENLYEMNSNEINNAEKSIQDFIQNFNYQTELSFISNDENLRNAYPKACNYEKVLIFRIFMQGKALNSSNVLEKYINEIFHIENDSIYQLDPIKFDTVPQYIIDECDRIMSGS